MTATWTPGRASHHTAAPGTPGRRDSAHQVQRRTCREVTNERPWGARRCRQAHAFSRHAPLWVRAHAGAARASSNGRQPDRGGNSLRSPASPPKDTQNCLTFLLPRQEPRAEAPECVCYKGNAARQGPRASPAAVRTALRACARDRGLGASRPGPEENRVIFAKVVPRSGSAVCKAFLGDAQGSPFLPKEVRLAGASQGQAVNGVPEATRAHFSVTRAVWGLG